MSVKSRPFTVSEHWKQCLL